MLKIARINGKRYISINFGISASFVILVIITTVMLSSIVFLTVHQIIRNDLQKRIHDIVAIGVLDINGDDHDKLISGDENSAAYQKIKNHLRAIRNNAKDVRYVYTMKKYENGDYVFIVDADEDEIGDVYDSPTPTMKKIFKNQDKAYVESNFNRDEWGVWMSGYAPIYTSDHKFSGVLGIDVSVDTFVAYERKCFAIITLISLVVSIFVIFIGVVISRRITEPLKELESDIDNIRQLKFGNDLQIRTVFKEILSMNNTVNNMKTGLRSFAKYVPADLVNDLILLNKEAKLNADKKEITLLFTDIADFTTISEKINPDKLVNQISDYLSGMANIIHNNAGTIDKYIGDAIMSFWGAPKDMENHAYNACLSAIQCREFLKTFNAGLMKKEGYGFTTRIGINTGVVVVGNMGSEDRLNYTAIGDSVNLASRLEKINKFFRTDIIISEFTYNAVKDTMLARKLGRVAVKGKTQGIFVYELICEASAANEQTQDHIALFNEGVELYLNSSWEEAIIVFEKNLQIKPDDPVPGRMIEICIDLINKRTKNWDGILYIN